jgi:hypothetical protein
MKTLTDLKNAQWEPLDLVPISTLAVYALETPKFTGTDVLALWWSGVCKQLFLHAAALGQNEKWVNRHPISVVFANRFAELTGISEPSAKVMDAIEQCKEWANG